MESKLNKIHIFASQTQSGSQEPLQFYKIRHLFSNLIHISELQLLFNQVIIQ